MLLIRIDTLLITTKLQQSCDNQLNNNALCFSSVNPLFKPFIHSLQKSIETFKDWS